MKPSRDINQVIVVLAALAVCSLVAVTWALTRISTWIVYHDPVWGEMDAEGAQLEHYIAEAFFAAGRTLLWVESVVGAVLLFYLWRALYSPQDVNGSNDAS